MIKAWFVKRLSVSQKSKLKAIRYKLPQKLVLFCAKSPLLSVLYNLCIKAFNREQRAVLAGRAQFHLQRHSAANSSDPSLRRNIHRIEKGIIMQPRRVPFAVEYIDETLKTFVRLCESANKNSPELQWAADVLRQYFSICGAANSHLGELAARFAETVRKYPFSENNQKACVPYAYADLPVSSISYEDYLLLCRRRRSVRWFLPTPVPKSLLEQAIEAATLAPSACNRQPFRFFYTLDSEKAASIASIAIGTTGFANQFPALIVVIGDLSQFEANRDRHVIYIDASLASMQMMLALDRLGLASCPINWPDIESAEKNMENRLGLNPWERPVMLIAFGYADPAGGIAFSQKKTAEQLLVEI